MEKEYMDNQNKIIETGTGKGSEGEQKIKSKRGRPKTDKGLEDQAEGEQIKFFIDTTNDIAERKMILKLLEDANNKPYGREILLKDLLYWVLPKITAKDIEKIQDASLSEMEKVEKAFEEYNIKNQTSLSLGEFLVKRLGIS